MSTLADTLSNIESLRQTIAAKGKLPPEILQKINYKFRLECNYQSNRIEGGTLTKSETRSVMVGNITVRDKPLKDIREMKGHDEVMQQILRIGRGELKLSERRMLDIHKTIIVAEKPEEADEIGVWKTTGNHVINYQGEKFEFTPPGEVKEAIHQLLNWLNAGLEKIARQDRNAPDPLLLAFEFHLRFLTIHPFSDGNGRTARIYTNLVLIALGYPPFWVSEGAEKEAYNRYLADIQGYGGSPDLLYGFLAGLVERSLRITLDAVEGKEIDEMDDWMKKLRLLKSDLPREDVISVRKSAEVLNEVFSQSIFPLIQQAFEKLKEFDDLFVDRKTSFGADTTSIQVVRSLDEILKNWHETYVITETIFGYALLAFKKTKKPFDISLSLHWKFEEFHYSLFTNYDKKKFLYRLPYAHYYSQMQMDEVVKQCGESLLSQINTYILLDNREPGVY